MYLAPEGHEVAIASAAAEFLAETMPVERLHVIDSSNADMSAAVRGQLGEMGWFALALPEDKGGSALSAVEFALFFREVGRNVGALDVLTQSLAALACTDETLRAAIVSGAVAVTLAVSDAGSSRLLGARDAAYALVVDETRAGLVALADVAVEPRDSLDPATSMTVATLPEPGSADTTSIWQLGALGTAAMLVGLAEAALDQIVEYAKVRETFGKKIGSWQAVRHPCADMAVRLEAARSQLWYAATAIKEGREDAQVHLDAAKYLANLAAVGNADSNIQLHGGIGVTDEHHAHLFLKHALVLSKLFGSKRRLLGRLLHAAVAD